MYIITITYPLHILGYAGDVGLSHSSPFNSKRVLSAENNFGEDYICTGNVIILHASIFCFHC